MSRGVRFEEGSQEAKSICVLSQICLLIKSAGNHIVIIGIEMLPTRVIVESLNRQIRVI
jgi:hypothetical protein